MATSDRPGAGRGRIAALITGLLGLAVVSVLLGRNGIRPFLPRNQQSFLGQKVRISKGDISKMDFLRFLSDYTGMPLVGEEAIKAFDSISIANDVPEADDEIVKAILLVNKVSVEEERDPSGRRVLRVVDHGNVEADLQWHYELVPGPPAP